jgi:hypothetical protein
MARVFALGSLRGRDDMTCSQERRRAGVESWGGPNSGPNERGTGYNRVVHATMRASEYP